MKKAAGNQGEETIYSLIEFKEKWSKTYSSCVKNHEENCDILQAFFAYLTEICKIIYTTIIIE